MTTENSPNPEYTLSPDDNGIVHMDFKIVDETIPIGYREIQSLIKDLEQAKKKAKVAQTDGLKLGKKEHKGKYPYHLLHKYGCQYSDRMDSNIIDANLYSIACNTKSEYIPMNRKDERFWIDNEENISRMKVKACIERFVCDTCASALLHWHRQRRYFLPLLANTVEKKSISEGDISILTDTEPGSCDTCGTPESTNYNIETGIPQTDVSSPSHLCQTCYGLLFNDNERDYLHGIPQIDISDHTKANHSNVELTPITDPNYTLPSQSTSGKDTNSENDNNSNSTLDQF